MFRGLGRKRLRLMLTLLLAALALTGCGGGAKDGARVLLDGADWDGQPVSPEAGGLRVYITLDGAALIDLPFSEPRTVAILQPDGAENVVAFTGDAVYMESANCENQDCVNMGRVTEDNLEMRVMGGFIICLPHKVSVEVR